VKGCSARTVRRVARLKFPHVNLSSKQTSIECSGAAVSPTPLEAVTRLLGATRIKLNLELCSIEGGQYEKSNANAVARYASFAGFTSWPNPAERHNMKGVSLRREVQVAAPTRRKFDGRSAGSLYGADVASAAPPTSGTVFELIRQPGCSRKGVFYSFNNGFRLERPEWRADQDAAGKLYG